MEISITAYAHYDNGNTESFYKETDVSEEEYNLIKQCAEESSGELDSLEEQNSELYDKLHSLFEYDANELACGSYRPIRTIDGESGLFRRTSACLLYISMYYEE